MSTSSEQEKQQILTIVERFPGIYLTKIAELLSIQITKVESTLQELIQKRLITVKQEAGYKRYYIRKQRLKPREKRTAEIRKNILLLIAEKPGLHLSEIAKRFNMSIPLTDYHLLCLEKNGEITVNKDSSGHYKRYYITESEIKSNDREVVELLRNKKRLEIVFLLLEHNTLKHKEILNQLSISPSTVSYHLNLLLEAEIIVIVPHGTEKGYIIKNRNNLIRILETYNLRIEIGKTMEQFKNIWSDLKYKDMLD